jgi:hypothetical protein
MFAFQFTTAYLSKNNGNNCYYGLLVAAMDVYHHEQSSNLNQWLLGNKTSIQLPLDGS